MLGLTDLFGTEIVFVKYLVLQLPVLIISAVLYCLVTKQLLSGRGNTRKNRIVGLIIILWVTWVILTVPYSVYEMYQSTLGRAGMFETGDNFKELYSRHYDPAEVHRFMDNYKTSYSLEMLLFIVKQSFSLFNSVLLIVMIRPFYEPIFTKAELIFNFFRRGCKVQEN